MWVCIEIKDQKLTVYGLFCCNNCAIDFAEEQKFREASFHEVQNAECIVGDFDA